MAIKEFTSLVEKEMAKVITGQKEAVRQIVLGFLAGGHVILEGVPGLAKTLMARTFSRIIDADFRRIQFTPDLMPSDIIGTNVFDISKSAFVFRKGPVFTSILLADEINRTSPKTQAALLEAMQERQCTVDGVKYPLPEPFMVLATQNPVEFEGTYPLPEAQLDRFLMKVRVGYPSLEEEVGVLKDFRDGRDPDDEEKTDLARAGLALLKKCRTEYAGVRVDDSILAYIMDIVRSTRESKAVLLGASTRSAVFLLSLARYAAAAEGRDYVIPDDVKKMVLPVLRHRVVLAADTEIEGTAVDEVVGDIVASRKVPR
jgi:MoxR-like ATPase